jgi:CheY-like chemotaxis protein
LLAFSRRQHLRPEHIVLHRMMAATGDLVRRAVGEAVTVEIDTDPQLWPSLVDPSQFESAILNLAINARDAMPDGGRLLIAIRNAAITEADGRRLDLAPGDYVAVTVSDTGSGMAPEVQQRCFEPFFTTKDVGKGTGLGLSQVYGFARQSGGTVTVESLVGQGTTIALYLPRTAAAIEDIPVPSARIAVSGQGKTVLIVEDQDEVRLVMEVSLSDLGYRVLVASDAIAARRIIESDETINLLVTDVVMPKGVNGIELARWARRVRQDLRIVLVSGYSRQMKPQDGGEEFVFLEKPFRPSELAETIATALQAA